MRRSALAYLAVRSARNRIMRQVRRLRRPRYAVALVLGVAYLWAVAGRQHPSSGGPPDVSPAVIELLAAVGVTLILAYTWLFGSDRRALTFSRAEVTWLFPAPVTRAQLIRYKLLRGQFVVLFNVLLWTFLLSRDFSGGPWRRAAAIWVLLTTLALHRLGAALLKASLWEHGAAAVRARVISLVALGLVVALALTDMAHAMPGLRQAWDAGLREFLLAASDVAARPIPHALLLPTRLMVRPMLAEGWSAWAIALLPALAILLAHYLWVIRSDAAFEETAAAAAFARAQARPTSRAPRFSARPVPQLAPHGWPAGALLWKNLVAVLRAGRVRSVTIGIVVAAAALVGLSLAGGSATLLEIAGWMAAMWAGFLFVLGPQWIRNDLRTDLARLAVLRSYPVRGAAVVGAETAGSTVLLTALQLGLLTLAWLGFWGGKVTDPPREVQTALLLGAVLLLPGINYLAMLIQNGAVILLPGWVTPGADRPIGVEALGHNMLIMSGFLLVLAMLLLLPTAAAVAIFASLKHLGWWPALPAALAALALMALEARVLLGRLGRVFEATDPESVPPAELA